METPLELEEYMGEILDLSIPENKKFVEELLRRRRRSAADSTARSNQSSGLLLAKKDNLKVLTLIKFACFHKYLFYAELSNRFFCLSNFYTLHLTQLFMICKSP